MNLRREQFCLTENRCTIISINTSIRRCEALICISCGVVQLDEVERFIYIYSRFSMYILCMCTFESMTYK